MGVVLLAHVALIVWAITHRVQPDTPSAHPLVVVELLRARRIANDPQETQRTGGQPPRRTDASKAATRSDRGASGQAAMHAMAALSASQPTPAPARQARSAANIEAEAARLALESAASASAAASAAAASAGSASSAAAALAASAASTATAVSASAAAGTGNHTGAPKSTGEKFALLRSADLRYDTFFNGAQNQSGTLHWRTDGRTYELAVSLPLPFVGTFSYISQGHIDGFGLAPDVYTEQHGRRGTDISRFYRDAPDPHVAFTRTPKIVPLPDGGQDRFSMIFQLASLVAGDPSRYRPGVTRAFFVVDNDSAENWPIQMIGPETVSRMGGPIEAVHFMRLPRHDGDRRRIDVWLAPSLGWLPVRIMQTEPNGTQIELVYHGGAAVRTAPIALASPATSASPAATGSSSSPPTAPAAAPAPTEAPASAPNEAAATAVSAPPADPNHAGGQP